MKTYIYILQDPENLLVRYVGKSNNPLRRYRTHMEKRESVKYHSHLWIRSLQKKGLKPIMTIIDETEDNWQLLEQYWITQFKAWGYDLTNHTLGGEGQYGAGQWFNKPVSIYDLEGNYVKSFISQQECANFFNTTNENVSRCINKNTHVLAKKYLVKSGIDTNNIGAKGKIKKAFFTRNWSRKSIKCIEDNLTFSSITDAANYYKTSSSSISNIIKGITKKTRNGKSFCKI